MEHVISESCYKGTILQRNYSFVKFHGIKNWESHHEHVISKSVLKSEYDQEIPQSHTADQPTAP